jgi:uncharacterized protein
MRIKKSFDLKSPREHVWNKFNDVRFVAECLPGAAIVGELGINRYKGRMAVKVGPIAAAFDGEVAVESHKQLWTGVVSGRGADSKSSSRASGTMTWSLAAGAVPAATRVDIVSDINLAGPLAQFGKGPIVQEIANRITETFVANFESRLAAWPDPAGGAPAPALPRPAGSLDAGGLLWAVLWDRVRAFFVRLFGRSPKGTRL